MSGLDEPGEEPFVPEKRNDDVWKRWRMTDLATRIADVKKKAEKAKEINAKELKTRTWAELKETDAFTAAASPSLFIEMADEIARLTAEVEKAREALEPFVAAEAAKAAKGVWLKRRGTITTKDTLEDAIDDTIVLDRALLRTAARVHAEITEAQDAGRQTPRS